MTEQSPAEALFFSALEKSSAEARAAYLAAACGDDVALRHRVERMLAAHPKAGDFLKLPESPTIEPTALGNPGGESAGTIIAGRYKLLEQIGEGGMGVVWVADQFEPVRRRVALKVIKPGMDSRAVLARFEAERQALALMDHPNIARVLDAGTSDDGRPYFVMELVKGVPITEFCDARRLTPRERLELFVPVCQAIQHAHQKGIIHRDIKPSNVLVALHDEKPVPKVIDFGVAKAIGGQLTDKTVYTRYGALVGTPAYMAPEQATFNQLDIDTRTDVYALGVLLYELLAGSTPLEPDRLKRAAFDEMLRLLREEEPPRPSLRLSTSQSRASVAAVRRSDPDKLSRLMRGELDWIVMKALEKDRNRRYETPTGLAADVQRYLTGEAVQAHPPSAAYRLRKFVRKHRALLTSGVAFAVLLLLAAAVSGWLAVEARRAEKLANEQREEVDKQRKELIDDERIAMHTQWFLWGVLQRADIDRQEAQQLANNLQVDADLAETDPDERIGLLRLCRKLKTLPGRHIPGRTIVVPGAKVNGTEIPAMTFELSDDDDPRRQELREFVTAAILAGGQESAPLLPPITHDGQEILDCWLSPDRRTLLSFGKDATARLWDVRTARQIAVLRNGSEKVVNCGFSPNGRIVFTDDESSVARFWDVPLGTFRAEIAPRPNRYEHLPDSVSPHSSGAWSQSSPSDVLPLPAVQIGDHFLLTWSAREQIPNGHSYLVPDPFIGGPVELWDTATGQLTARLDIPADAIAGEFQLQAGGRWVTAVCFAEHTETVENAEEPPSGKVYNPVEILVFSTADGNLVRRLPFPDATQIWNVAASPTGRRIATIVASHKAAPRLWIWDTASWHADSADMPADLTWSSIKFLTDDLFLTAILPQDQIFIGSSICVYRYRDGVLTKADTEFDSEPAFLLPAGKLALLGSEVYETDTEPWRRLMPPPGRKFHPALADFVPGCRFIPSSVTWDGIVDIKTDKFFATPDFWMQLSPRGGTSAIEFVATYNWSYYAHYGVELRFLPSAEHLDLPSDLLELWAQVAVRGELAPDGSFVKWDEPTWEEKRQELAVKPAPDPDLPFPGFVASDRLHWLRAEYGAAASEEDRQRLAKELLRRAEENDDRSESFRWRAIVDAKANPSGSDPMPAD